MPHMSNQTNQFHHDLHYKIDFSGLKSAVHYSRKCVQLGLRIQDGSLCILLRITPEPLQ